MARAWSACSRCMRRPSPRSRWCVAAMCAGRSCIILRGRSRQVCPHCRARADSRIRAADERRPRRTRKPQISRKEKKTMAETKPTHPVRQDLGQPRRRELPDGTCILYIDRHLLHEVTSPQAFEGLRMRRPQAAPSGPDDRGGRPQHSHSRFARSVRHQGRGQPHPGRDAGKERRRVRRAVYPDPGCAAGHRAHHRAGAGLCRCRARPSCAATAIPPRMARWGRWRSASARPRWST